MQVVDVYDPHPKHKATPSPGRRGTLCPRNIDAAALLRTATPHPENPRQRFNILDGAAYRALPTDMKNSDGDDMWHGHPFPLEQVPTSVQKQWIADGRLRRLKLRG